MVGPPNGLVRVKKKKRTAERLSANNHPITLYFVGVVGCRFAEAEHTVAYGNFIGKAVKVLPCEHFINQFKGFLLVIGFDFDGAVVNYCAIN